ncbi:MAG TPA: hypothetical protein VMT19_03040 [Thermoanaerobaculaceae bacterium]|nr:hypothetical protein [Thermoanaerobaculaceae bacterium]
MRKVSVVLAAMLLASTALAGTNLVRSHVSATVGAGRGIDIAGLSARLTALYGADAAASYVGSAVCLACHNGTIAPDASGWHATKHAQMLRRPLGQYTLKDGLGVIANQAGKATDDFITGLDLSAIGAFSAWGANAPKLSYDSTSDTYWWTIGALKCQMVATIAGSAGQDQRYLLRVPVTDTLNKLSVALYYAPATYSRTQGWQPATGWYDANGNPKFNASTTSSQLVAAGGPTSHTRNCVGCHVTGIRSLSINTAGEAVFQGYIATVYTPNDPMYVDYNGDGNLELTSIGCEACHGPGASHVLASGDPTKIVNPAKLTGAQAAEICGRCHTNVKSAPNKTWGWPYHDDTNTGWIPQPVGTTWEPVANAGAFSYSTYGDGILPSGHIYQYTQFLLSGHGKTHYGQGGSAVACNECHDMHDATQEFQIVTSRPGERADSGITIPTSADNDSLCLSCHYGHTFPTITAAMLADFENNRDAIAKAVSGHTNHPFAPERTMGLSRCATCHMSSTAGHTWFPTRPEDTLTYATSGVKDSKGNYVGYPNACADSCHNTLVNIFGLGLNPAPSSWTSTYSTTLATDLKAYYGPGGTWWNTTPAP